MGLDLNAWNDLDARTVPIVPLSRHAHAARRLGDPQWVRRRYSSCVDREELFSDEHSGERAQRKVVVTCADRARLEVADWGGPSLEVSRVVVAGESGGVVQLARMGEASRQERFDLADGLARIDVPCLHDREECKPSFERIVVTVVVLEALRSSPASDGLRLAEAAHDGSLLGQRRVPATTRRDVTKVVAGRVVPLEACRGTEPTANFTDAMGARASRELEDAQHGGAGVFVDPRDAAAPLSEWVPQLRRHTIRHWGTGGHDLELSECESTEVGGAKDASVRAKVEQVCSTRSLDVEQQHSSRVVAAFLTEARCRVHHDRFVEVTAPAVRPVPDGSVQNFDDVGQPVPGHVRQEAVQRPLSGRQPFGESGDVDGLAEPPVAQVREPGQAMAVKDGDIG